MDPSPAEELPRLDVAPVAIEPRALPATPAELATALLEALDGPTYIANAWRRLGSPGDLGAFKAGLLAAYRAGLVSLTPGDASHPSADESATRYTVRTFHIVDVGSHRCATSSV